MQLVVLAGGLGTRLRGSIPNETPKPMALVGGQPFLAHVLDRALDQGVTAVVLLVGHRASAVARHFGDSYRGVTINYSFEPSPLGTGGAILNAAALLAEEFILLNGDTYAEVDFRALVGRLRSGPLALSLTPVADAGRFGAVAIDEGRAVRLIEKGGTGPGLINAGIYACQRSLLGRFPPLTRFSFEKDVLETCVPELRPAFERTGEVFFDIGVPEDLAAADRYFGARRA